MTCPQCGAECDLAGRCPACHEEATLTLMPEPLAFLGDDAPAAEVEGFLRVSRGLRDGVSFAYRSAIPCLAVTGAAADVLLFAALHLIRAARAQKGEAGETQAREAVAGLLTLVAQQIQETSLVRLAPGSDTVQ